MLLLRLLIFERKGSEGIKKLPVLRRVDRIGDRKNGRAEEMPVLWWKSKFECRYRSDKRHRKQIMGVSDNLWKMLLNNRVVLVCGNGNPSMEQESERMSREILFKAKREDNGEWVEGYYQKRFYLDGSEQHLMFWSKSYTVWEYAEIDPDTLCQYTGLTADTLCQYTGLTDKNGRKIWENDIVKYTFDYPSEIAAENGLKERISSVFWSKWRASWSVYADERKGKGMNNELFKYVRNGNTVEIIGNIFDNPELLEVE